MGNFQTNFRCCYLFLLILICLSTILIKNTAGQKSSIPPDSIPSSTTRNVNDYDDYEVEELSKLGKNMDGKFSTKQAQAAAPKNLDVAPLDIHHLLDTVNGLVGIIGGGASSLVVELTGISLTDCALSFNGIDTSSLSCDDFLDILSTCDSLTHVKPLLKAARKKLRHQHIPTNRPCSRNKRH